MGSFLRKLKLTLLIFLRVLRRHNTFAVLLVAVLVALGFLQARFSLFYNPNILRVGIIGTYQEHDIPTSVTKLLSDSLVEVDSKGEIKPKLVKGWEVNNDATVFKFKLQDNLYWADGTKISAKDLSFNIPDVETSAPDESTIQFKLKDSYSPFPSLLTKPVFKQGTMTGTGPYYLTKIEKSKIFITKVELTPKDKSLPKVFVRFYPNEKIALTGFDLGEVAALLGISNPESTKANPRIVMSSVTDYGKIVTLLYNTKDPLLGNRSLRQALSFEAPKIEGFEEANNPYPKAYWAYDPDSKKYLNDASDAKAALERAKSSIDESKLKAEITLTAISNLEGVGNKVVSAWKNLGFNVTLRTESGIPQNFQILLITQSIPADPDQYFLWHSTQDRTNLSKYSSARVDKDLEDGRKTTNQDDRKAKYFDFQHTLLEDSPATFLYFPKYNVIYLKKAESNLKKIMAISGTL